MKQEFDVTLPPFEVIDVVQRMAGQVQDWGHKYLQADEVYNKTKGGKSVIFICDTAGAFDHPDLIANTIPSLNKNFTDSPDADVQGHGTHCAGIAAARDNGIGVIGIAPEAALVAVKVLNDEGSGTYGWIAQGLRYVADCKLPEGRTIKIASLSLGGSSPSSTLKSAIDYAQSKGVIIVCAAGNSGYNGTNSVDYPGRYEEVITVASLNQDGGVSNFSSGGGEVDVATPGGMIYSTFLNGSYALLSGTSMATPAAAGAVCLIMELNPGLAGSKDVEAFLEKYAKDIYTVGEDERTGAGTPLLPGYVSEEEAEFDIITWLKDVFVEERDISRMREETIVRLGNKLGLNLSESNRKKDNCKAVWNLLK